jgi:cystathionine gamma-lyase
MVSSAYGPAKTFAGKYLDRFGVEVTFVKGDDVEEFRKAIKPNTKLIYLESPSSLIFVMQDLKAIAELAREHGIATVIDNTWATPIYQNPLKFGIDMVVHSATKYLGGHSDIVAGVLIGRAEAMDKIRDYERGLFGANMDPHQAWLLIRGLRTLPLRLKQHAENALKVAKYLEQHPKVERVIYPALESHPQYQLGKQQMSGYSGLFSIVLEGGSKNAPKLIKELKYFQVGPSWGGFESLISGVGVGLDEAASKATGIPQGLIRVSIGLENADSLIEDFETVLSGL